MFNFPLIFDLPEKNMDANEHGVAFYRNARAKEHILNPHLLTRKQSSCSVLDST